MSLSKPRHKSFIERFVDKYVKYLNENPILTKAVTSGVTAGLGNLFSQLIAGGKDPVRWRSVVAFALTGSIFAGPIIHYFLIWIDKAVPRTEKYSKIKKVLLDRFVFAPPFLLIYFFLIAILEGQTPNEALSRIGQFFWPTLKMNWKVWTPLQFININYIPSQYRVLFANVVSLGWTVYVATTRK